MKTTTLLALVAPALGCLQVHCPVQMCAYSLDNALNYAKAKLGAIQVSGRSFIGRDGATWGDGEPYIDSEKLQCKATGRSWIDGTVVVWRDLDDGQGICQKADGGWLYWAGPVNGQDRVGPCRLARTVNC